MKNDTPDAATAFLALQALQKFYGRNHVVRDLSFTINRGELVSFLGPSGCGKTTVLRMVAGFDAPTTGQILIDGVDVTKRPPNQRSIGMVFQAYALFPNMTVFDNIAFGLRLEKKSSAHIKDRVGELLDMIQLPKLANRYPAELSGGQQQRVALARALARNPDILLLDEPLSALDAKIRLSLRDDIRALQKRLGITTIFVTHDQEEALSISDRVVIMNGGRIEQAGTPRALYSQPRTRFVTKFLGAFNVFDALVMDASSGVVAINNQNFALDENTSAKLHARKTITLAIRPEALNFVAEHALSSARESGKQILRALLVEQHFFGAILRLRLGIGDTVFSMDVFNRTDVPSLTIGDAVSIAFDARDVTVLDDEAA